MLRPPSRRLIITAVIGFWAVMTALLVHREVLLPYLGGGRVLAYAEQSTDDWMGVYLGDEACIGVVNTQVNPDTRDGEYGQTMLLFARLSMQVMSYPTELILRGRAWASRNKGLRSFHFEVSSGGHEMSMDGAIEGGVLEGTIETAGEQIPLSIPVGKELLFSGNMGTAALNVPALEPGEKVYLDTFDPMTLSAGKAVIECVGEETIEYDGQPIATKVLVTAAGGITSKAWVDMDNHVIRAETPFGFTLKKLSREEALRQLVASGQQGQSALLGTVAIRPTGKKPRRGATRMRIRVSGVAEDAMPPMDFTQRMGGRDRYVITAPETPNEPSGRGLSDSVRNEALRGDHFVQAHHATIRAQAAEIVGGETDPWRQALAIYDWVYANIEKTPVMSLPSALEVLEQREGDCNEHTVLFTALARAAGLPTRIAIGVVWSDELDGFYYHAWPEVFVGRWTWMDPTLGQPVADATHIKLLEGGIERWSQLLAYLGSLEIEVLDIEFGTLYARSDGAAADGAQPTQP